MAYPIRYDFVEQKINLVRNEKVILDSDVASLYGVLTKHVNQAVKNNPDKFPSGYVIELEDNEWRDLRSKFLTANRAMSRVNPKAFTEKGLYMLATILKSEQATQTSIAIIETFTKLRLLTAAVGELNQTKDEVKKKNLLHQTGSLMNDLLGEQLQTQDTETTIELNFAVIKLKHTIKRK
jgi:hypothetical protein